MIRSKPNYFVIVAVIVVVVNTVVVPLLVVGDLFIYKGCPKKSVP